MATKNVWAISMVKDEADIIRSTVNHLLAAGIDGMLIADNGSTDGTAEILDEIQAKDHRLQIYADLEVGYYQSIKMTRLAHLAAQQGAHWIIPFDADEWWYSLGRKSIADQLRGCELDVVRVPMWNHFCTDQDPPDINPITRMLWHEIDRNPLPKVAYRYHAGWTIAQGSHGILDELGYWLPHSELEIGIRHFPYRSPAQFESKVRNGSRAYAATNLPPTEGDHWRGYGRILEERGVEALNEHFDRWFLKRNPAQAGMLFDPAA